jgi:triphosphoribosyl-dephospho-CoA synthetase
MNMFKGVYLKVGRRWEDNIKWKFKNTCAGVNCHGVVLMMSTGFNCLRIASVIWLSR